MIAKRIIIHCSATPNGKPVDISEIRKWHLANGWSDVGYHLVIQPDGEAQKGRGLNVQGAHCEGENQDSIGICLIGMDKFTRKQFDVLRYQLDAITMLYSIPKWNVFGHYQFKSAQKQGKLCPNISINNLLAWYLCLQDKAIEDNLLKTF